MNPRWRQAYLTPILPHIDRRCGIFDDHNLMRKKHSQKTHRGAFMTERRDHNHSKNFFQRWRAETLNDAR